MDASYSDLRSEIANHQDYAVRTAMITFSAVAVIVGLVATRDSQIDVNTSLIGVAVGALLLASLLYQNAAARKIFWIGGFLACQEKSVDERRWENVWEIFRKSELFHVGIWAETRAIAYCYTIVTVTFMYMFRESLPSIVLHVVALVFCVILWLVPSIEYKERWKPILDEWEKQEKEKDRAD